MNHHHYQQSVRSTDGSTLGSCVSTNVYVSSSRSRIEMGALKETSQPTRDLWANPAEFLLSILAYAVGLGNIWRFPYLCYENGGGAFLIPYTIMLLFVGIPMFFMDLSLGQYSAKGTYHVFDFSPLFRGLGIGMLVLSYITILYYNQVIAWAVYYIFASCARNLPWHGCHHDYNTPYCYSKPEAIDCETANGTWFNMTCFNNTETDIGSIPANLTRMRNSSAEEYFNIVVLSRSSRIEETGSLKWDLSLCLLLVCTLLCASIIKGIRSSGKVVYVTAIFPYVILTILVARGCMLDGAWEGIKFYLIPEWQALISPKTWVDAAGQIFFTLSLGTGALLTLASYNRFNNNIYRDALVVTIANCLTSIYAGFAIFSVLGFMAKQLGQEVSEVAKSGPGLAFVVYPEVVTHLPLSQFWSFIFFFMILLLGLGSQFAPAENLTTAVTDFWPVLRNYKPVITVCLCVSIFLGALTTCTEAGVYWIDLMGFYVSGWAVILIATFEVIVVGWFYGVRRLKKNVEMMVGFSINPYWMVAWKVTCPVILLGVLIYNLSDFKPFGDGDTMSVPWAQALGWMMAMSAVVVCPVCYMVYIVVATANEEEYRACTFLQRLWKLTQPSEEWKEQSNDDNDSSFDEEAKIQMLEEKTIPNGKELISNGTSKDCKV